MTDGLNQFAHILGELVGTVNNFLSLVKPYLYDNLVFLFDNPERLCAHYVDAWADLSAPLTLRERLAALGRGLRELRR